MKKRFRITVNGKTYDVEAELMDEGPSVQPVIPVGAAAAVPTAGPAAPAAAPRPLPSAGAGAVPSPLAGKVVSIDAPVGTAVTAGQKVLTLEAMKMNTVVAAPVAGTVSAVHVAPGDSVEEGQSLVTIS